MVISMMVLGYIFFIQNFELFPSNRIELVEFTKDGSIYKVYGFNGNVTVSSNIQLYRNEVMLGVSNTVDFYNQGKIIEQNDSTINLLLRSIGSDSYDSFKIKFIEPVSFKVLNEY